MTTRADIEDMIARVALHDRAAFASLYDATSGRLFAVCISVLRNRALAEDVLQEVFLQIWRKAGSYAVTGHSPMTWLITIARNKSIDRLRRNKAQTTTLDDAPEIADTGPSPEAAAIASSERARMMRCLDELEETKAEAVRGAYLRGDTYQELAARFDVPLNTMRTWLRRSLIALRACLTR